MSRERFDVVGIGNAMVDIIARCDANLPEQHGLKTGSVRRINGELSAKIQQSLKDPRHLAAGSAVNTVVGVSSLGGRAAFIGLAGDDDAGRLFDSDLASTGVAFKHLNRKTGAPTSHNIILVTPDGRRTIGTMLGCSAELDASDIDSDLIETARITYLEGYLLDSESAHKALIRAMEIAKAAGRLVALGLSHPRIAATHRESILTLVKSGVDILLANEIELTTLYETSNFVEAGRLAAHDTGLAALTRGRKGSYVITRKRAIHVPVEPCGHIVDITGAGDLYAAGFLTAMAEHNSMDLAARLGNVASGAIIQQLGARPEKPLADLAFSKGLMTAPVAHYFEEELA
jgi:sugar/nucleoside kinase (ribokinase family)